MKNYTTEEYIKGFVPELTRYLWQGETNYGKQKEKAEQIVLNDFLARGYRPVMLQNELVLRASGNVITEDETGIASEEDKLSRMRFFADIIALTGEEKKITLQGSNDKFKWADLVVISCTETGIKTTVINSIYNFYRVNAALTEGSIDFFASLTETTYDLFFAFKWIQLILEDAIVNENDQYIQSAINYAQSQSPSSSNQWTIYIIPKKTVDGYMENITLQPYVHLTGLGRITRVKGNITGMNLNTKLSNLFFFQEGNFTVQNIKADSCIFHTSGDPEVEIFTLTLQSGVFKDCGFFGTRNVLSNGNNRFYGSCFCNKTDEKNSSDIGELYSLNNSAELYQL